MGTQIFRFFRFCFRGNHHGLHGIDLGQLIFGILKLKLQLFHLQPFPFQRKVRKGRVKAHQKITFFYRITLCHQNFRDGLGVADVYGLDLIRGHRTVAFLGIAPVFGHAQLHKGEGIHRLRIPVAQEIPAA